MKDTLLSNLANANQERSEKDQKFSDIQPFGRRSFLKFGAATITLLATGQAALACKRYQRGLVVPVGPALVPPPPPPPPPLGALTFEVGSGVHPHEMLQILQEYVARTLTPDFAGQVVQAQAYPRQPATFHQQFGSDYILTGQIPPTRTRYGYYLGVDQLARSDANVAIRPFNDLNYFETRRLVNPSEINQYGLVLLPWGYRQPPTPADYQAFAQVSRRDYGIPNPEALNLVYTRRFVDSRNAYQGFLVARGNNPMQSPYKDLLISSVPV